METQENPQSDTLEMHDKAKLKEVGSLEHDGNQRM
jgi:hypothetical protein